MPPYCKKDHLDLFLGKLAISVIDLHAMREYVRKIFHTNLFISQFVHNQRNIGSLYLWRPEWKTKLKTWNKNRQVESGHSSLTSELSVKSFIICQVKVQVIKSLTQVHVSPFPASKRSKKFISDSKFQAFFCGTAYPVEDGDYGGNYAVEADNCNNQNPVKSTVLYCSYRGFMGYIAMVSWKK